MSIVLTATNSTRSAPARCPVCVLRRQGLCRGVDLADADGSAALEAAHAPIRVYAAGEVIYRQGDESGHVYNLITGWVALHRDFTDGRRHVIGFVQPGALFGTEPAGEPLGHTATALTNASVCPMPIARLDALRQRIPSLNERFVRSLQWGIRELLEMQSTLGQGSAKERIGALLAKLAAIAAGPGSIRAGEEIRIPLTQRLIAEATGLTSIHVNRVLRQLRESGIIEFQHGRLTVIDEDRLRALSEPGAPADAGRRRPPLAVAHDRADAPRLPQTATAA